VMMPRVLFKRGLLRHGGSPPGYNVGAKLSLIGSDVLMIEYVISGSLRGLLIPPPIVPQRRDELWRRTCFEAFIGSPGGSYVEFNFAPSREWASYRFEAYRSGMEPAHDLFAPPIFPELTSDQRFGLTAFIDLRPLSQAGSTHVAVSAVIEETDGTKSYWALAHPPGEAPDFHHPAGFVLELPAPG
jgi:hypothetical protein